MAMRLAICSFIEINPLSSGRGCGEASGSTRDLFQLDIGAGHHSLAAKEQQGERFVSGDHRPHLGYAHLCKFGTDRLEKRLSDAAKPSRRLHRQCEDRTARCGAELPRSYLTDDEALR